MPEKIAKLSRRMGAGRMPGNDTSVVSGGLEEATVITTIRRMGYVLSKVHEIVMARLIAQGEGDLAERFNDTLKPLVDLLVHFELGSDDR